MPSFTFNLVTANYVFSFENSVFCLIVVATPHIVRNHFRVPFDPFDTKLWQHPKRSNYLYLYLLSVELLLCRYLWAVVTLDVSVLNINIQICDRNVIIFISYDNYLLRYTWYED